MQAAVNGIRSSGATSQLILVEGTSWTGAWSTFTSLFFTSYSEFIEFNHLSSHVAWTTSGNSDVFGAIQDPNNNVAIRESPKSLILLNHDRIMDSVCEKCRNASISRFGRFWNFSNMCLIYHWRRTFTSCYSVVRTK